MPVSTLETLGERLRSKRKAQSLSQAEVAVMARVSNRTVSELERGKIEHPNAKSLMSVCLALKCSYDETRDLFAWAGDEPPSSEEFELAGNNLLAPGSDTRSLLERLADLGQRVERLEAQLAGMNLQDRMLRIIEQLSESRSS